VSSSPGNLPLTLLLRLLLLRGRLLSFFFPYFLPVAHILKQDGHEDPHVVALLTFQFFDNLIKLSLVFDHAL